MANDSSNPKNERLPVNLMDAQVRALTTARDRAIARLKLPTPDPSLPDALRDLTAWATLGMALIYSQPEMRHKRGRSKKIRTGDEQLCAIIDELKSSFREKSIRITDVQLIELLRHDNDMWGKINALCGYRKDVDPEELARRLSKARGERKKLRAELAAMRSAKAG